VVATVGGARACRYGKSRTYVLDKQIKTQIFVYDRYVPRASQYVEEAIHSFLARTRKQFSSFKHSGF
jgi:hypothetical protein